MKHLHKIAYLLIILGGINWLLFGLLGWEVGSLLGGMESAVSKVIYVVVGVAAVYEIATHKGRCKECGTS